MVTGLVLLFILAVPAQAWEACGPCSHWDAERETCVDECSEEQGCCDETCYDTATKGCCDGLTIYDKSTRKCCNEETGHTCLKDDTCCDGDCCEVCCSDSGYYCCDSGESCCEGSCYDSQTQGCCDGTVYNLSTQKCCDGLDPCDTDYICDIDETCCDGLCVDPTIDQCCDDIGGYNDGYSCPNDEECCGGTCCDPDGGGNCYLTAQELDDMFDDYSTDPLLDGCAFANIDTYQCAHVGDKCSAIQSSLYTNASGDASCLTDAEGCASVIFWDCYHKFIFTMGFVCTCDDTHADPPVTLGTHKVCQ